MTKIAFFDIDGTLLNSKKQLPLSTKQGITALQKAGIPCVIATGRAPYRMVDVRDDLDINSYVSLNGQYVVHEERIIHKRAIAAQDVLQLAEIAEREGDTVAFCTSEKILGNTPTIKTPTHNFMSQVTHRLPRKMVDKVFHLKDRWQKKIALPFNELSEKEIYQCILHVSDKKLQSTYANVEHLHFTRWNDYSVDVCPPSGSKAQGIEAMLNHLNIDKQDAIAFGDGQNDIEMLRYVGIGIAMGNASDEVKKAADLVTTSNDQNGIHKALAKLKLI